MRSAGALVVIAACARPPVPAPPSALAPPPVSAAAPAPMAAPAPPPRPGPAGHVDIRFTHDGGDTWSAEYTFAEPVTAIAFALPKIPRDAWRVVEPADGTLADGTLYASHPFTRARVTLPTSLAEPEYAYRPFTHFTDQGVLVYTGQLYLHGGSGVVMLSAAAGETVVVAGEPPAPETADPSYMAGTMAYFGTLAPIVTGDATMIVDRGLPGGLRGGISDEVARVFAFYAARLGALPAPKPTIFVAFGNHDHGMSIGGGAMSPHVLAVSLELGPALAAAPDSAMRRRIDIIVAHEAAHLWTDRDTGDDKSQRWMREGLPDAFALRALRATGAMTSAEYRAALSDAASECAMWLSDPRTDLSDLPPGHVRAAYVCGATVGSAVEAGFATTRPGADLLSYWSTVLAQRTPPTQPHAFFAPLTLIPKRRDAAAAADVVVSSRERNLDQMLRRALTEAGLTLADRPNGPLSDDYEQHASVAAVEALLPPACVAALTFDGDTEVLPRVAFDGACPGLAKNDRIETLAGVPLGAKGATAWDTGYASCQSRHVVDVGVRGQTVSLPCDPAARPRPAYFDVQGAP